MDTPKIERILRDVTHYFTERFRYVRDLAINIGMANALSHLKITLDTKSNGNSHSTRHLLFQWIIGTLLDPHRYQSCVRRDCASGNFMFLGWVDINTKIKNRKKKRRKRKGCLGSSPGAVTSQVASPEHKSREFKSTITHHTSTVEGGILPRKSGRQEGDGLRIYVRRLYVVD
ncbi:hypothetical protein J6590_025221 [Homalodisca vitripennis]|nr:hypothetical protein J6590_025221 [Homalodisca vitripennis]